MHWDREGQLSRFDSSVLKLPVLRHSGMLTSNGSIMAGDGASIGHSMRGVRELRGWPTCDIKAERVEKYMYGRTKMLLYSEVRFESGA